MNGMLKINDAKHTPFALRHFAVARRVIRQVPFTHGMSRAEIKEHRRFESLYAEGQVSPISESEWVLTAPANVEPKVLRMHGLGQQPTKFPKGKWRAARGAAWSMDNGTDYQVVQDKVVGK